MHNENATCLPVIDGIAGGARRMTAEHCSAEWRVIEVSLHRMRLTSWRGREAKLAT
jgi:hypothetical protein